MRMHLLIREECVRTLRVTTRILQIGILLNLNLRQIAKVACHPDLNTASDLEKIVNDVLYVTIMRVVWTSGIAVNCSSLSRGSELDLGHFIYSYQSIPRRGGSKLTGGFSKGDDSDSESKAKESTTHRTIQRVGKYGSSVTITTSRSTSVQSSTLIDAKGLSPTNQVTDAVLRIKSQTQSYESSHRRSPTNQVTDAVLRIKSQTQSYESSHRQSYELSHRGSPTNQVTGSLENTSSEATPQSGASTSSSPMDAAATDNKATVDVWHDPIESPNDSRFHRAG
eukprot:Platyproteum_vivax@DN7301_c0_g1_i4.p1